MKYQIVIIFDISLIKIPTESITMDIIKLVFGYTLYFLPVVCLLLSFSFGWSQVIICTPLSAQFLLDNGVDPVENLSELYQKRKDYANGTKHFSEAFSSNGGMLWDVHSNDTDPYDIYDLYEMPYRIVENLFYDFKFAIKFWKKIFKMSINILIITKC